MRILFMGTPDFSVSVLKALQAAGHRVVAVYTRAPRPAGRGKKDRLTPVHEFAGTQGWPVETPLNFKNPADVARLKAYRADVGVVVAYGLILPQAVLDAPLKGCLNLHASLLPRWRGAAPVQRAIEAGDAVTGASVMQMDAGLDTGPEVARIEVPLTDGVTSAMLHHALALAGSEILVRVLNGGDWTAVPQARQGVTYARKIDKAECAIDWNKPAPVIARKIRAFSPFPGAFTTRGGERLKLLNAKAVNRSGLGSGPGSGSGPESEPGSKSETGPGTVLSPAPTTAAPRLVIAAGNGADKGAVSVSRLQPAGKPAMDVAAYLNGKPFAANERLG